MKKIIAEYEVTKSNLFNAIHPATYNNYLAGVFIDVLNHDANYNIIKPIFDKLSEKYDGDKQKKAEDVANMYNQCINIKQFYINQNKFVPNYVNNIYITDEILVECQGSLSDIYEFFPGRENDEKIVIEKILIRSRSTVLKNLNIAKEAEQNISLSKRALREKNK